MLNGDLTTAKKHFFSALSDETRLSILHVLKENHAMCVSDICKAIGKDQSLVSHHLTCLRNCGLVNAEKNGKFVVYSIKSNAISKILDLSEEHVKEMLQGILSCEVVKSKNKKEV